MQKGRRLGSALAALAASALVGFSQARVEWLQPALQAFSVAPTDDGAYAAVTMGFGALGWMRLDTGVMEQILWEDARIYGVDIRGDLMAYGHRNAATVRRISTGQVVYRWSVPRILNLRFSPDGALLAVSSQDFRVRVWRMTDGALLYVLPHTYQALHIDFSPDGQWIATADGAGRILIWSRATGALVNYAWRHTTTPTALAFAPNSQWIASASGPLENGLILSRVPANTMEWFFTIGATSGQVVFAPDSASIFVGGANRVLQQHATATGALIASTTTHAPVHTLKRAGQTLVAGEYAFSFSVDPYAPPMQSYPSAVQLWDITTGALTATHYGAVVRPMSLAVSRDGSRVAVGDRYGYIRWYNAHTGALLSVWQAHPNSSVASLAVSPDGSRLVSAADNGTVRVWDTATNQLIHDVQTNPTGRMARVAVSPDGQYFAALSYRSQSLPIWSMATGDLVNTLTLGAEREGAPMDFDFTPDSTAIAAAGLGNILNIADIASGEIVQQIELPGEEAFVVRYAPDGRYLLVGLRSGDYGLWLWDTQTQAFAKALRGADPFQAEFVPDSQTILFTTPYDVRVWYWGETPDDSDVDNYSARLVTLYEFAERSQMGIAPDGKRFYLAHEAEGIGAWRLPNPADVDDNGCVDDADLLQVLFAFGATGQNPADVNRDGTVDDADLLLVLFDFGDGC
ncbi:MAG: hypothetical protein ACK4UU_00980 [Fimbriimonadales bacterium]